MLYGTMLKELGQFHRELDEFLGCFGTGGPHLRVVESRTQQGRTPQVNLSEDADNLYLNALLPGIDPAQLEMEILGDTLSLGGEHSPGLAEAQAGVLLRRERNNGKFQRKIELPVQVEAEQVTAEYRHGLLRITLPKATAALPKKIEIKVC